MEGKELEGKELEGKGMEGKKLEEKKIEEKKIEGEKLREKEKEDKAKEDFIIGGKYRLIKKIGKGGGGSVYMAEDLHMGKIWAVKEVKKGQQFEQEAETLRSVRHKNLPLLVDVIRQEDKAYLVLEYIEGSTLQEMLQEKKTIPLQEGIRIGIEVLEALKCLHHQNPPVVYGDLKPSNIMLDKEGCVKLIDFGTVLSGRRHEEAYGTIGYAAPEQVLTNLYDPGIDQRTDIYCFGILLYKMITGEYPKDREGMKNMQHPYVGDGMKTILFKCMAFEKDKRYERAELVIEDLKRLSGKERRKKKRKQAANAIFLSLFLLSIAFFVLHNLGYGQLLYPSVIFWFLSYWWYRAACKKKEEFYQGDGIRLFLSAKKIPGLLLMLLWVTCSVLVWNALFFSGHMQAEAAGRQEIRDEFGRKVLVRE